MSTRLVEVVMSTAWRPLQIGSLRAGLSQSCVDDVCAAVAAKVQWWFNSVDFDFPTGGWELAMAFSWMHTCTRASTLPPMSWLKHLRTPAIMETNTARAYRSCAVGVQCCEHGLTGQRMAPNGFHFSLHLKMRFVSNDSCMPARISLTASACFVLCTGL